MTCGIYCVTNTTTGDRYIGKSKNIERRVKDHRVGKQKDLVYEVLQVCVEPELNEAEWDWVAKLRPELNRTIPVMHPVRGKVWQNPGVTEAVSGKRVWFVPVEVRLKQVRETRNLSQFELAQRAGMSPQTIQKLEQGRAKGIQLNTLDALCDALDCNVNDLLVRVPAPEVTA